MSKPSITSQIKLDGVPPCILAAIMARSCKDLQTKAPEAAHTILGNMWGKVAEVLLVKAVAGDIQEEIESYGAILFLNSYFQYKGDWEAMENDMLEGSGIPKELGKRAIDILAKSLTNVAVEKHGKPK